MDLVRLEPCPIETKADALAHISAVMVELAVFFLRPPNLKASNF